MIKTGAIVLTAACALLQGCTTTSSEFARAVDAKTKLILPEYRTYVKTDKKLGADDRRIRLRSADEFEKLVEAANRTQ